MFGNIALIAASALGGIHNPFHQFVAIAGIAPAVGAALISGIPWLLSLLFGGGGGNDQTSTTTSETTNPTYRSPALGLMEPGILSALLGNARSMGGAGMPGGVSRFGGSANSMFSDIIGLLSKEWPTIMKGYGDGATKTDPSCDIKCKARYGPGQLSNDPAALADCIATCNRRGAAPQTPGTPA